MHRSSPFPSRWSLEALTADRRRHVLDLALALERAECAGQPMKSLRGKHLAVLCEDPACLYIGIFRQAANALGAQVTHIRPSDISEVPSDIAGAVGKLLGKLYDALDCHELPPSLVEHLRRTSGKPVFTELGCRCMQGEGDAAVGEYVAQALLLSMLS